MHYEAQVKLDSNHINLRSGTVCTLASDNYVDIEKVTLFGKLLPNSL